MQNGYVLFIVFALVRCFFNEYMKIRNQAEQFTILGLTRLSVSLALKA